VVWLVASVHPWLAGLEYVRCACEVRSRRRCQPRYCSASSRRTCASASADGQKVVKLVNPQRSRRRLSSVASSHLNERLFHPPDAVSRGPPRQSGVFEFVAYRAGSDAQLQAPVAQHVQGGGLAGHQRRNPEAAVQHVGAQPQSPGDRGGGGQQRKRCRTSEVVCCGDEVELEGLDAPCRALQLLP
jgi:hypothetical protein